MNKFFKFPHGNSPRKLCDSVERFLESEDDVMTEFARLQEYSSQHCRGDTQTAASETNRHKNRYMDVIPYSWRTVRIPDEQASPGEEQNKYINASWIVFKNMKQPFIASQGPMEDTVSDFWVCVREHSVRTIVMLTALQEGGRVKCAQYWPDGPEPLHCHNVTVRLVRTSQQDTTTVRTFALTDGRGQGEKLVTHIEVKEWSDYSIPDSTAVLLNIIQLIEDLSKQCPASPFSLVKAAAGSHPAPVLVHCSAGVGRTGTLIAAYRILQEIKRSSFLSQVPSPWETVVTMRAARPMMVQQFEQYKFIFEFIRDFLKSNIQ